MTQSGAALLVIAGTHAVIDRFRLVRYLIWARNQLAPARFRAPWSQCSATGYPADRPVWLTVWLMIVADNTVHLLINTAAIAWL